MSNPKDCIHCYDYEDMGCKMPVCEFDFPSINTPKCNGCSKFIKRDLVQVVRCKDCKKYIPCQKLPIGTSKWCDMFDRATCEMNYCGWGERREDG